jgi:hypothetical protein
VQGTSAVAGFWRWLAAMKGERRGAEHFYSKLEEVLGLGLTLLVGSQWQSSGVHRPKKWDGFRVMC